MSLTLLLTTSLSTLIATSGARDRFDIIIDLLRDNRVSIIIPDENQIYLDLALLKVSSYSDTAQLIIQGQFFGDAAIFPVTGWMLPDETLLTSKLFSSSGGSYDASTAIAWRGSPASSTIESYNNGRDPFNDGNSVNINPYNGYFEFNKYLDWNPLKSEQAPLINQAMVVTQGNIQSNDISGYEDLYQPIYAESGIRRQYLFRPFMRRFNDDGTQKMDVTGKPMIARFPKEAGPIKDIVLAAHIDKLTHGAWAGLRGIDQEPNGGGDHYDVVIFDISGIYDDGYNVYDDVGRGGGGGGDKFDYNDKGWRDKRKRRYE